MLKDNPNQSFYAEFAFLFVSIIDLTLMLNPVTERSRFDKNSSYKTLNERREASPNTPPFKYTINLLTCLGLLYNLSSLFSFQKKACS